MVVSLKSNLIHFCPIEIEAEIDIFLQYHNLQILLSEPPIAIKSLYEFN